MKICITGYRPNKLPARYGYNIHGPAYQDLAKVIQDVLRIAMLLNQDTELECISGMALGIDQLYVDFVSNHFRYWMQAKAFKCSITAAVPCRGQEKKWPVSSREEYHKLLALCDKVHYVTNGQFTPTCMENRNRWMVDNSDAVIAVYDGKPGGTANCVKYARRQGKTIYYINPETLRIRKETNDKIVEAKEERPAC